MNKLYKEFIGLFKLVKKFGCVDIEKCPVCGNKKNFQLNPVPAQEGVVRSIHRYCSNCQYTDDFRWDFFVINPGNSRQTSEQNRPDFFATVNVLDPECDAHDSEIPTSVQRSVEKRFTFLALVQFPSDAMRSRLENSSQCVVDDAFLRELEGKSAWYAVGKEEDVALYKSCATEYKGGESILFFGTAPTEYRDSLDNGPRIRITSMWKELQKQNTRVEVVANVSSEFIYNVGLDFNKF